MPLSKSERQKLGLVGKKKLTSRDGETFEVDYESEDVSILTDKEAMERLGFGKPRPTGKNFSNIYNEAGEIVAVREIIEIEDSDDNI